MGIRLQEVQLFVYIEAIFRWRFTNTGHLIEPTGHWKSSRADQEQKFHRAYCLQQISTSNYFQWLFIPLEEHM